MNWPSFLQCNKIHLANQYQTTPDLQETSAAVLRQKWLHYSGKPSVNTLFLHQLTVLSAHPHLEDQDTSWAQGSTVPNLNISVELPLLLVCIHISFISTAKYLPLSCPCSQKLHSHTESMRHSFLLWKWMHAKAVQESPSTEPDEKARKYCKGNFCKKFLKFRYPFALNNHQLVVSCNIHSSTIGISGEFPQAHKKKKIKMSLISPLMSQSSLTFSWTW